MRARFVGGLLLCSMLFAGAAFADANAAYSANAVGVIKYTVPANGQLVCISLPLNPMSTSNADQNWVFGETEIAKQLPPGSDVYFWNGTGWDGVTSDVEDGSWGRLARNKVLQPGEAFFVRGPASVTNATTISLLGEVPTDATVTYSLTGNGNLDVRGVTPYPVDGTFGTTSLAQSLPPGTDVYFWSGTGWDGVTSDIEDGSWGRQARNQPFSIGQGVFIRCPGAVGTITNACPYQETFNNN